ncbi:hypothetical protein Tco_0331524 [Tanacetum coccineum]
MRIFTASSLAVNVMTSLLRVLILSETMNLLRGGNISTGIDGNTSAEAAGGDEGFGDTLHLLGGGPIDDGDEDRGLLRDGPK